MLVVAFEKMGVDFVGRGVYQICKICWSRGLNGKRFSIMPSRSRR